MLPPDLQAQLEAYNQKVIANTITEEELRAAVRLMRQGRAGAAKASAAGKVKAAKAAVDGEALLEEFMK